MMNVVSDSPAGKRTKCCQVINKEAWLNLSQVINQNSQVSREPSKSRRQYTKWLTISAAISETWA